jgi:hypothetical protein
VSTPRSYVLSARRGRAALAAWQAPLDQWPRPFADDIAAAELRAKAAAHPTLLATAQTRLTTPLDLALPWDKLVYLTINRFLDAAYYYRFTGEARALAWAEEALAACERCDRPHYTYSSCLGVLDIDLRSGELALGMAMTRWAFGAALPAALLERLTAQLLPRLLTPGLHAMRTRQYAWMRSKANWRIIIPGCLGIAALAWADRFPEWRAVVDFGLDGWFTALGTGDAAGGWNEGPGYWEYGLSYGVLFAWALRQASRGRVDAFRHPFLRRTGDFRLQMHTHGQEQWNWSDCGKTVGNSLTLALLARVYRDGVYQHHLQREGLGSLGQLYFHDPELAPAPPASRLPLAQHFPGLGVIVARTGFTDEDTYLGVKAADIPNYNHHCHHDAGSLVLHAAGRELLAENNHWPYPREGRRQGDPRPASRPGLWDEELHRWLRWDLDSVSPLGHNGVMLEGHLPRPRLHQPPRLRLVHHGADHDLITVDSTAYYRPLASRVRRTIVFLRPGIVILVDDVRTAAAVRATLLFHYLDQAELVGTGFRFVNGPAELLGTPLCPTGADNLIVGLVERRTTYEPPAGLIEQRNRFVTVENLWRRRRLTFVTALQVGAAPLVPARYELSGHPWHDAAWTLTVAQGERAWRLAADARGVRVTAP